MRTRVLVALSIATACGSPAAPSTQAAVPELASAPEATWIDVGVAGRLELVVRAEPAPHEGDTGLVFRVTNHGDAPILADLRSLDRVVRPDAPAGVRLPLSDEQTSRLLEISALVSIDPERSITYAVPFACEGAESVALGGTLTTFDNGRVLTLVADGASATVSCAATTAAPPGTIWVSGSAALEGTPRAADAFTADFPTLLRGASIAPSADVSLLAFSYDARPIERWRYDACVSLDHCPARTIAQPPGSIGAPAVGMSLAGAQAFCETRSLRAMSPLETASVGDQARALLDSDAPDLVTAGFRCARTEADSAGRP